MVETLRLEEEMAGLPRDHRHAPAEHGGPGRIDEQQRVGADEAERAHQVQRLVDAALVIEAMVVPALLVECFQEGVHAALRLPPRMLSVRYDATVTPPCTLSSSCDARLARSAAWMPARSASSRRRSTLKHASRACRCASRSLARPTHPKSTVSR